MSSIVPPPSSPQLIPEFSEIYMPTEGPSDGLPIERKFAFAAQVSPFYESSSSPLPYTHQSKPQATSGLPRRRTISLPAAGHQHWRSPRAMTGPFEASPTLMRGLYYDLAQPPDVAFRTEILSNTLGLLIPAAMLAMSSFSSTAAAISPPTPNILVTIPSFGLIPVMASDGVAVRFSDILGQIHDFLWSPLLVDLVQVNQQVYNAYERRIKLSKSHDDTLRNVDALDDTVFVGLDHDQCDETGKKWIMRLGGSSAVQV